MSRIHGVVGYLKHISSPSSDGRSSHSSSPLLLELDDASTGQVRKLLGKSFSGSLKWKRWTCRRRGVGGTWWLSVCAWKDGLLLESDASNDGPPAGKSGSS